MIMQGRKRLGRKDTDYAETLTLFQQLIHILNSKIVTTLPETYQPKKKKQTHAVQKKQQPTEHKQHNKQPNRHKKQQKVQKIGLRSWRDWQGLCSQRKQDILGEYAICFQYSVAQQLKMPDHNENGFLQSQSYNNT